VSIYCSAHTTIAVPITKKRNPIQAAERRFLMEGKGSFLKNPIPAIRKPARRNLMLERRKGGMSSIAMKFTK
jgi:hypothetical protein